MFSYIKSTIHLKHVVIIAINALCLIAFIVSLALSASVKTPLRSQQAARAWAGQSGERFAQLSFFFPESAGFNEDSIREVRTSLDNALLSVSLESDTGRILYTDAWAANGEVSVLSERGSTTAPVIGVGGDFFLFHPLYLRDGTYLSPNDIMKDRVVLDEELAWRLFGSVRLAGFEILINGRPFIIAGVVSRESDFASAKAYTGGAGMFMSFEALMDMTDDGAHITCYEIVMPDPITGFALGAMTDIFTGRDVDIVENSARFSLEKSFAVVGAFGERSMRKDTIMYPYWENAARYAEDWLALLLVMSLLFIICPAVFAVIYLVKIIHYLVKHGKITLRGIIKKHDDRKYEKYILEHYEEPQIYDIEDIINEVHNRK